jgi:hypothetical protein
LNVGLFVTKYKLIESEEKNEYKRNHRIYTCFFKIRELNLFAIHYIHCVLYLTCHYYSLCICYVYLPLCGDLVQNHYILYILITPWNKTW